MAKIKFKESIYVLKESEDIYQVVLTALRQIKRFKVDNLTKDLISEINSENESEKILNNLRTKYPLKDLNLCLKSLEEAGIVYCYDEEKLNPKFKKQLVLINELSNSWEETLKLQGKIENSKVTVFGVGGIGSWVVNGLYQIGIQNINICDPDKIEASNLNRQLYFRNKDINKFKVNVIKERLSDINIRTFQEQVRPSNNLEEIVKGSDILINCADNPSVEATSRIIDKYSRNFNIPFCIAGGYNLHMGLIGPIFIPEKTVCYDCFIKNLQNTTYSPKLEIIKDVEDTGSLGPMAGAIANMQVMQIFKFIIGKGDLKFNQFAELNFLNFNINWIRYSKDKDCQYDFCYEGNKNG